MINKDGFAIVNTHIQQEFAKSDCGHEVPSVCGVCGIYCKQINTMDGACREMCQNCDLAKFAADYKSKR